MNTTRVVRTIIALVVFLALGSMAAVSTAQPGSPGKGPMMGTPGAGMMGMAEFDLMFIDMMIVHHEGAVAMANVALERGEHPELVQLAGEIVAAQEAEIAQLQAWRDEWYPGAPVMSMDQMMGGMMGMMGMMPGMQDMMGMMPMMGMMDPVAMGDLLRAAPEPFDLAFIDAMIPHHLGALMMTEMAVQQATHPELVTLAQEMFDVQMDEVQAMRDWRAAWYGPAATPAS